MVNVIAVNAFSPYMVILRRLWIHATRAVSSTLHVKVKFPAKEGIVVMKGDQKVALQCLVAAINYEIKKKNQVKPSSL